MGSVPVVVPLPIRPLSMEIFQFWLECWYKPEPEVDISRPSLPIKALPVIGSTRAPLPPIRPPAWLLVV